MSMKLKEGQIVRKDGRIYVSYKLPNGKIVLALDPDGYQDIVNLPDPVVIGLGVWVYNYTMDTLWFTVEGSGEGWNWIGATQLDSVASGGNKAFHVGSIATRAKPGSATTDNVLLTFTAYSDAYITEVGTYPVIVAYHWIDSDAMSLLDLDNFEDGTLQGWDKINIIGNNGGYPHLEIATNYVLSPPNSMLLEQGAINWGVTQERTIRARVFKSFDIPDCSEAYFIGNIKLRGWLLCLTAGKSGLMRQQFLGISHDSTWVNQMKEQRTDTGLIYWTGPLTDSVKQYVATNWLRLIAPLPVNQTIQIRIELEQYGWFNTTSGSKSHGTDTWFDDLKVVYSP